MLISTDKLRCFGLRRTRLASISRIQSDRGFRHRMELDVYVLTWTDELDSLFSQYDNGNDNSTASFTESSDSALCVQ